MSFTVSIGSEDEAPISSWIPSVNANTQRTAFRQTRSALKPPPATTSTPLLNAQFGCDFCQHQAPLSPFLHPSRPVRYLLSGFFFLFFLFEFSLYFEKNGNNEEEEGGEGGAKGNCGAGALSECGKAGTHGHERATGLTNGHRACSAQRLRRWQNRDSADLLTLQGGGPRRTGILFSVTTPILSGHHQHYQHQQ